MPGEVLRVLSQVMQGEQKISDTSFLRRGHGRPVGTQAWSMSEHLQCEEDWQLTPDWLG